MIGSDTLNSAPGQSAVEYAIAHNATARLGGFAAEGQEAGMDPGLRSTRILGVLVTAATLDAIEALIVRRIEERAPLLVTFVNPGALAITRRMPDYAGALDRFDLVLPDGIGMSVAVRWLRRLTAHRVSFDTTSLAPVVIRAAERLACKVALVGGQPGVAEDAARRLRAVFPNLDICAALDGFGDHRGKAMELAGCSPDIVICGMGVGVQEKFLLSMVEAGWVGVGFTCGGYLDQLKGHYHYYPGWIDAAHLRWAYRLAREPRRLARRYGIDYSYFVARFAIALAGLRLGQRLAQWSDRLIRLADGSDAPQLERRGETSWCGPGAVQRMQPTRAERGTGGGHPLIAAETTLE